VPALAKLDQQLVLLQHRAPLLTLTSGHA
jgi:hypothetical protein